MDKEFLDKIFEQTLEEASTIYLENEKVDEELEDYKFSDIHNKKMEMLFNKVKKDENRKKYAVYAKRVAMVVVCATLITCGLITTVEAWRKEVVKFIMKNNDDNYMSIKFGDDTTYEEPETNETDVKEPNQYITDEVKFMYLPEGFEFHKIENIDNIIYYNFKTKENYICFRNEILGNVFKESDIEKTSNEKIDFGDKQVFKIIKDNGRINYVWYDNQKIYSVLSDISEEETLKFIEKIKILKNF